MKNFRFLLLALCFAVSLPGFAEKKSRAVINSGVDVLRIDEGGYKHEILLNGASQGLPISAGSAGGNLAFGSGTTLVNFSAGYNYDIIPILQLGIFPSISYATSSGTFFSVLAGPTVNLSLNGDLQDAFFLSAAAGVTIQPASTGLTFRFDMGKRFKIFEHLSYEPSVGILKIAGFKALFVFNLMGGSVHF